MFGIKLRSWMEAHIVRPRKKRSKEGKGKGSSKQATTIAAPTPTKSIIVDPNPAATHSSASPAALPAKRVTLVSPTPSARISHPGRDSPRRPPPPLPAAAQHRGRPSSPTAGGSSSGNARYSTYLSSPESAYSTGYSTDATSPHGYSPGTSLPPEYYINLRTGTRYFQSAERQQQLQQQQQNQQQQQCGGSCEVASAAQQPSTSSGKPEDNDGGAAATTGGRANEERVRFGHQRTQSTATALHQQHHHPYCRHTVAKVSCTAVDYSYGAPVPRHRRTESADASHSCSNVPAARAHHHVNIRTSFAQVEEISCVARRPSLVQQQQQQQQQSSTACNSPRQRSRIRTNPWMSSGTTGSSSTGEKHQWTSSSCSDIAPAAKNEDISTAATVGSWRREDGHTTTTTTADEESCDEVVTAFRRPSRRRRASQEAERKVEGVISPQPRRGSLTSLSCSTPSTSPSLSPRRSSPSSGAAEDEEDEDEDLTLNEIGRFDESYVYEKETDILSDSDPTDCEGDEVDGNLTDRHSSSEFLDMSYQNGIHSCKADFDEDELDFIDNGPLDMVEPPPRANTGHCTYHLNIVDVNRVASHKNVGRPPSVNKRPSRRRGEGSSKRSSRKQDHEHGGTGSPARRSSQRKSDLPNQRRAGSSSRRSNKIKTLAEAEVSSSGQVTPIVSTTNTPVTSRRNSKPSTPIMSTSSTPVIVRRNSNQFTQTASTSNTPVAMRRHTKPSTSSCSNTPLVTRRNSSKQSPAKSNKNVPDNRRSVIGSHYFSAFPSEVSLIEADKEADRKYQQLILEAETLLVHMKNTSVEEDLDLLTPTVENPPRPFPQRLITSGLQIKTPIEEDPPLSFLLKAGMITPLAQTPVDECKSPPPLPPRSAPAPTPPAPPAPHTKRPDTKRPDTTNFQLKVIEPNKPATSSNDTVMSERNRAAVEAVLSPGAASRALVTFRSVDLSSPVAAEAPYCPQSEPLKRKVYSSAALQRLQEHLALADLAESSDSSPPDDDEHSAQGRLGQKVAELRRERLAAEARLASREEERRRRRDKAKAQQTLALTRRHTLLRTIESLKRDLQSQSASLHDAYRSITDLRSPSAADAQRHLVTPPHGQAPSPSVAEKACCDFLSPIRRANSLRAAAPRPPPP